MSTNPSLSESGMFGPVKIGIIGGSGVEEALAGEGGDSYYPDTPFGKPAAPIKQTTWGGVDVAILQRHGEGHVFNPSDVPYRANIFAMKMLGVTHIIATGATGSLREELHPGDLVIPDQVIDKTYKRPNTFFEHAAVHTEMAEPFCPVMRQWFLETKRRTETDHRATKLDAVSIHEKGTYVVMEGPAFSTQAESHMHRLWGGDLIGMTCMPEAKLAREAEIAYALLAFPTDYDCWKPHEGEKQALLAEIIGNLKKATANSVAFIREALRDITVLEESPSPAHDALALAIWSRKDKIADSEIDRLRPLWGRYFEA